LEYFIKHQKVILRTLGGLMLVIGFAVHFWDTPKKGLTESEIAAANVARMEASVAGKSSTSNAQKPKESVFLKEFKSTREKQMKYLTIIAMILGLGFLIYSFIKKDDTQE